MKSVITAIGALALAASAAQAAPLGAVASDPARAASVPHAYTVVAARQEPREKFVPNDWATNRGAGTSRSNDANDG